MNDKRIVIFDGVCDFCNGAVNFIIYRDPDKKFLFSRIQSEHAKNLVSKHDIKNVGIDTFLLIKNEKCYIWTDAVLEIAKELKGFWFLFNAFKIVPRPIRDAAYRLFARNRYVLFGKTDQCMEPTHDVKERFVGL